VLAKRSLLRRCSVWARPAQYLAKHHLRVDLSRRMQHFIRVWMRDPCEKSQWHGIQRRYGQIIGLKVGLSALLLSASLPQSRLQLGVMRARAGHQSSVPLEGFS